MEALLNSLFGWMRDALLRGLSSVASLEDNVRTLQRETRQLMGSREDVQREVDEAEMEPLLESRGAVRGWLDSVQDVERQVTAIGFDLERGRGSGCVGFCSPVGWWSNYRLAARVAGKLEEVRDLKKRRDDLGAVARKSLPPSIVEMPIPEIVRHGSEFEEVMGYLGREDVGIVGIYGVAGIGKTILLKRINNAFALEACGFNVVTFVDISQELDLARIQGEICDRIGLALPEEQRAKALARALSRRAFLLLLDGVPQKLNFGDIGIPLPTRKSRSKIVLTTREEQVCVNMGAQQRVRLGALDDVESWRLFCITVGSNEALHSAGVKPYAQAIAQSCRGLPLAIVTVAMAMATKRSLLEWVIAADSVLQQQENEDLLSRSFAQPLGFTEGRPIAAILIYKSILWRRKLEADQSSLLNRVIQTIATAIDEQEDGSKLVYWLSNVSTLLSLIQQGPKPGHAVAKDDDQDVRSASSLRRMVRDLKIPFQSVTHGGDATCQVKGEYPVLRFKQQLIEYAGKIYGMVRDNFKHELSLLLGLIIQVPRASRSRLTEGHSTATAAATDASLCHWHEVVNRLENSLKTMRDNYVAPVLVQKMFVQIFWFINVQLFNSILLRRDCCSFINGEYIRTGLSKLERWCTKESDEFGGSAWEELKHVRQASLFLASQQKQKMMFDELVQGHCSVLSVQQIYRISTFYRDDKYGTLSISSHVLSTMREVMVEQDSSCGSFLLDDDLSLPVSVEELSKPIEQIEAPFTELPQFL